MAVVHPDPAVHAHDAEFHAFVEHLVREFKPSKVVWFGSRAYGTPDEHSDYDLLILLPSVPSPLEAGRAMYTTLHPRFGVDLIVRSEEDTAQRLAWGDDFLREIMDRGLVLYESAR